MLTVLLAAGGWSAFWYYAAQQGREVLDGWRAREAQSGRVYTCGQEGFGGFPFRFEFTCDQATALLRGVQPPLEIKTGRILAAVQIYQPNLVISEFTGPATFGTPGQAPALSANWKLAQSSLRGTPMTPERVSLVFDDPVLELVDGRRRDGILKAKHLELHGRIAEGSVADKPVIEAVLVADGITAPLFHPATKQPVDADITALLHGLSDFAPKPWAVRFKEIQAAGGRIEIRRARVQQGNILAVGAGDLALNPQGHLQGQLRLTVAGLEEFLEKIGAQQMVQSSPAMDRLAGALDRFSPGLGAAARQQAGANISSGIKMLGEQTSLEGRPAISLPMRFEDGAVFLGPIPIGNTPALF